MGLFSRVRRLHSVPDPQPEPEATPPPAPPEPESPREPEPAMHTRRPVVASPPSSLRDGLQQLYAIRPSRDAFAEEAIKLIVKGTAVKAAAILIYEQRQDRLKFAAGVGLESDALHILNGETGLNGWDIPLRSVRNRRINVIESAHDNPFVPRPLAAISPRRLTVASVPFYHANTPVGVVVLFSPTPRGFADGLLKTLSQALRVCALALAELPASPAAAVRAPEEEAPAAQPNLLRGLAALKAELARLTDALEEAERQRAAEVAERVTAQSFLKAAQEHAAQLEHELADVREAQSRVPDVEEQIHAVTERLAAAVEAADAARMRVGELEGVVGQHERRAEADAAAIAELTASRREIERQLQSALDTARQRGEEAAGLHVQVAELAPRAAQAADFQRALAASDAAKTETEAVAARLRQELLAAQDQRAKLEAALDQAHASLSATAADHQRVAEQLAEAQASAAALDRARQDLAGAEQELDRLRAELQASDSERAARQQELDAARAALSAEGHELAAAAERAAERIAVLEAEQQRLSGELGAARAQTEQAAGELRERGAALARLGQELTEREDALARAEAERDELRARANATAAETERARTAAREIEAQLAEQRQLASQLADERRALQERVNALAAGGQTLEQERQAAVDAAQRRVRELLAEIDRLSATLEAVRATAAEDLNRTRHDAESTLDALRVELAETLRARDELQRALAQSQGECASHQRALADMSAERTRLEAVAERLSAERAELSARVDDAGAAHATLARTQEEAAGRIGALERELQSVRDEQLAGVSAQLAAECAARQAAEASLAGAEARYQDEVAEWQDRLAAFAREQEQLRQALEEKDRLLQSAEEGLTALDLAVEPEGDEEILAIERDHAAEGVALDELEEFAEIEEVAEVEEADSGEMVLLDDDDVATAVARQLADFGHRVAALPPTPEGGAQLKDHTVAGAAINLAVPTAWSMVRHLRNGSGVAHMPLVAYALPANGPKGFWLGPVDFTLLPVEQTPLAEILNRMVRKVKRVIAMSNDIDVMSDVRTQLTAAGVSTAVVLDGRQALDLVPTIRPEAAVLHLSPSCVDVFRAIAGLRNADASRDIPILFLLDAEAQAREEAFLTAGMRMLTGRGTLAPDQLVDSLASAFDTFRM